MIYKVRERERDKRERKKERNRVIKRGRET